MIRECWAGVAFILFVVGLVVWGARVEEQRKRGTIRVNGKEEPRQF